MAEQKLIDILDPQAGTLKETVLETAPAAPEERSFLERENGQRMSLMEAATTYSSTFPQLLNSNLRSRFFNTYAGVPMTHEVWMEMVRSNRPAEDWLKDSPLGTAPIVPEGHAYPRVELDLKEVTQILNNKYGYIIPVTRESIIFDQYNFIVQRTQDRARSMAYTKEVTAYETITTAASYTRTTAAGDNNIGNNTGTTQFSASGLLTAFNTLRTMKDSNSGVYIGVAPNILICGVGIEWAAKQLLLSPNLSGMGDTDAVLVYGTGTDNPMRGVITQILVTPFIGKYEWVLMEKGRAATVQQVWDLDLVQNTPNSGNWFEMDVLEYKASEFWGMGLVDDRFAYFSDDTSGPTVT